MPRDLPLLGIDSLLVLGVRVRISPRGFIVRVMNGDFRRCQRCTGAIAVSSRYEVHYNIQLLSGGLNRHWVGHGCFSFCKVTTECNECSAMLELGHHAHRFDSSIPRKFLE